MGAADMAEREAFMQKELMIEKVRDYLEKDEWKYEYNPTKEIIRTGMGLKSKLGHIQIFFVFGEKGYSVVAYPQMNAGIEERQETMEFITRANWGLRNGNFEMDLSDGQVRYKLYVNTQEQEKLPEQIVKESFGIPILMFERYGDGLAAVMLGFSDAKTEIEKAERE